MLTICCMILQTPVKHFFFLLNGFFPEESIYLEDHIPRSFLSFETVLSSVGSEFRASICYCSGGGTFWGFQIYVLDLAVSSRVKCLFQSSGGGLQAWYGPV